MSKPKAENPRKNLGVRVAPECAERIEKYSGLTGRSQSQICAILLERLSDKEIKEALSL